MLTTKSKMSSASQTKIDRFNKYKSLCDAAGSACIRTFLHIVRPTEGFPYHSNSDIHRAWAEWKDAEEVFYRMTGNGVGWGEAPNRVFPTPPPEDDQHKPCRQMWGLLIQAQVEDASFQGPLIKDAVAAILASEACKSHSGSCACKVPNNPWTWHECVAELEPLGVKHNPKCQCGGYQRCKQTMPSVPVRVTSPLAIAVAQAEAELAANPELNADLASCRCDAQYSAACCSCLPSRLAEAKSWAKTRESARMAAAAKAASERATAEADKWRATLAKDAQEQLDAKPALNQVLEACYCQSGSCLCLPGRVHRAKEAFDKAAPQMSQVEAHGWQVLADLDAFRAKMNIQSSPVSRQSAFDYKHHVEDCPCGTCHKARVDSGTQGVYEAKCKRESALAMKRLGCAECKATKAVSGRDICMECYVEKNSYDSKGSLKMPSELHTMRQAYVLEEASWIATKHAHKKSSSPGVTSCFKAALDKAADAISVAAASSGLTGVNSPDFAKNLFTAMGTPHNSKCPHGLPFYACMPCSH